MYLLESAGPDSSFGSALTALAGGADFILLADVSNFISRSTHQLTFISTPMFAPLIVCESPFGIHAIHCTLPIYARSKSRRSTVLYDEHNNPGQ